MAEAAHLVDDRQQRRALLGQLVLDPRRRLRVAPPDDDVLRLEPAEALGERPRADPPQACSSWVKRRGPSERSWTISTVHFEPTISLAAATEHWPAWWTGSIVRAVSVAMPSVYGVNRPPGDGFSVPGRRVVHPAAADHRRDDLDLRSSSGGHATGSRSSTTRSARNPGRSLPRRRSSPASHAGATVDACSACSTVSACSGRQAGRSSIVRQHAGRDPGERVELLDGRVGAVRDHRAALEQRAERVGALEPVAPEPLGEVAVGRRVAELHRAGDAELREAREVRGIEALGVLDPLAQAERLPERPASPRTRRAPRGSRGRRSRARRPASRRRPPSRTISASSSPLVMQTPLPSSIQAVCEPSVPSMNAFR